jgi:leukotriene-A4 hydrolase
MLKLTLRFVSVAEELTSNYRWGVYDVLFLPESFPFGGMENACLTFATPTLIAGDKSSVDVVAHEISHVSS